MKFLIIRFSSIGDIVLTTPVIRCLKKQVPGAEVHFLVKNSFRSVLEHNPYIDKLHVLNHSWELMIHELADENYNYIIDLHHNARTLRIKNVLKKKSFSFYKLNIEKYIYTSIKFNILPKIHIVDRYLKTVESFEVKNDGAGLDYFIDENDQIKKEDIPTSHYAGYIGCVIGAAHGTKHFPLHKWKEFCKKMDHPIILLGGNQDVAIAKEIASWDPVKVYNACGKFSINESADLVRRAKLIVSNDTGLMHIAAAFKKPIISLWGNTVPSFGMYPYYGANYLDSQKRLPYEIVQVNKLWCRPCSKIGYKKCPLGHFKCMEKISVESLVESANRWL
ncbi:MAG TPA: glycosyltransferase family 9 protein [Chitinophagaceae bacterium]|nr:glycosyltransferase family 9 protein [Chitinophagaceae bacterium]